ncbi:universal stress protein (plasmid) [Haloarcula salina]|uniref:universal stress protein n=1 Tax=Haloarcula salina TaxID=1429914 RepID=UPI003C6F786F
MDRALVVIDDTDAHRELLAEAAALTAGADADLVVFSWLTPDEFEADMDVIESVERVEKASYGDLESDDIVRNFVDEFAGDVLASDSAEYEIASAVTETDDLADEILSAARRFDCDHVFLVGQGRSPTGKAIFGNVAQRVILNFGGYVTVSVE